MSQTLAAATGRRASAATARTTPGTAGARPARPPRPTLRVVRPPAVERGRTVFAVACLLLLVGGLLSLLLINTALAQGSFTLHDLQAQSDELGDREQALRQDIDVQAAPERLAARARALGMVPSQSPAFLRLSDGKLLGVAAPAERPKQPTVAAQGKTPAKASTKATKVTKAMQSTPSTKATTKPTTTKSR
ncbi:MAG: hypothetical protein ACTHLJ_10065 [Angustibacter sp.]